MGCWLVCGVLFSSWIESDEVASGVVLSDVGFLVVV